MAHEYTSWAYAQEIPGAGRKFVLVALADRANADGYSFPGQKGLASMTGQSERTIREHLEWLEAEGYVRREERRRKDGTRTSDAYYLPPMDSTGNIRRLSSSGESRRLTQETKPPVQDAQCTPASSGESRRLSEPRSTGRFRSGHRQISPVDDNEHSAPSSTAQTPAYQPADFAGHESFNHQKEPSLTPLPPSVSSKRAVEEGEVGEPPSPPFEDQPLDLPPDAAAVMARGPGRGQTDSHLPTLHPEVFKQLVAFRRLHGPKATDEMFRAWSTSVRRDVHAHGEAKVLAALQTTIGNFASLKFPFAFYEACLKRPPRKRPKDAQLPTAADFERTPTNAELLGMPGGDPK